MFNYIYRLKTSLHTQLQGFMHSTVNATLGLYTLSYKAFPSFKTNIYALYFFARTHRLLLTCLRLPNTYLFIKSHGPWTMGRSSKIRLKLT